MAASVEFAPKIYEGEVYGHSTAGLRAMGSIALSGVSLESHPTMTHNYDDFETAITENIATDDEFGENLIIDTPKIRKIIDGKVTAHTGQPVIDLVRSGADYSRKMVEDDPSYEPQAYRDAGDLLVAETADNLEIGEALHLVSMDPKEQFKKDPERWRAVGYREGMAVQHVFYRLDEDTMLTWTYTIKQSDKLAVSKTYREEFGVEIPEHTHSDDWIRHMHRSKMTYEDATQIGPKTLQRHIEILQSKIEHKSATEFVDAHKQDIQEYFTAYMVPLSIALVEGKNDPILQSLAGAINETVEGLKPEIKRRLISIANRSAFDSEDARLMQAMIRYATVEDLRKRLPAFLAEENPTPITGHIIQPERLVTTYFYDANQAASQQRLQAMNVMMAGNINLGVAANRSTGGCSAVDISDDSNSTPEYLRNNMLNRVDNMDAESSVAMGKDGRGPLTFKCPKGHENRREDGKELVEVCQKDGCDERVSCEEKDEKNNVLSIVNRILQNRKNDERK